MVFCCFFWGGGGERVEYQVMHSLCCELIITGISSWFLWRSAYLTKLGSWRLRMQVPMDWTKTILFGRDISRFDWSPAVCVNYSVSVWNMTYYKKNVLRKWNKLFCIWIWMRIECIIFLNNGNIIYHLCIWE